VSFGSSTLLLATEISRKIVTAGRIRPAELASSSRWLNCAAQDPTTQTAPSSILLFDDWNAFHSDPNKGERRAFGELLRRRPDIRAEPLMDFPGQGQGFVLRVASSGLN
jgi:hypothetical protein